MNATYCGIPATLSLDLSPCHNYTRHKELTWLRYEKSEIIVSKKEPMPKPEIGSPEDESIKARVALELDEAKRFAKSLNFDEVKSGEWFINLLRKVVYAYDRNVRAEYFQQKYPGLPPDEIADMHLSQFDLLLFSEQ
jgi:hypothetical protein